MDKKLITKSKYLSKLLRHDPEDLKMDDNGWVSVSSILKKTDLKMFELLEIVNENDKKRFAFNEHKTSIRANQGHTMDVDVNLKEIEPPEFLYHGTATRNIDSIRKGGINKGTRLHVHLSKDKETAENVGSRHGTPYIFTIKAKEMFDDGIKFYLSENGVHLTDFINPKYIL